MSVKPIRLVPYQLNYENKMFCLEFESFNNINQLLLTYKFIMLTCKS